MEPQHIKVTVESDRIGTVTIEHKCAEDPADVAAIVCKAVRLAMSWSDWECQEFSDWLRSTMQDINDDLPEDTL